MKRLIFGLVLLSTPAYADVTLTSAEVKNIINLFNQTEVMIKTEDGSIHPFIGSGQREVIRILQEKENAKQIPSTSSPNGSSGPH